ncbi:hypothetical protein RU639_002147 [Aspergillus parasiticus]
MIAFRICPQKRKTGLKDLYQILEDVRKIRIEHVERTSLLGSNLLQNLKIAQNTLRDYGHFREADALTDVLITRAQLPELGGLGLSEHTDLTEEQESEILFWCRMVGSVEFSRPGQDWVIASEASWAGMESTYNRLRKSGIFRNDRFWLAGDHVVDPRINSLPKVQALIDASERATRVFKLTDYQGMNYTILHTEFYRVRAQPGMLIVGSDSHTCSSGALGCLAIGLGAADVTMPLLSSDARFAISNMTAELGGITGVFAPDILTQRFIRKRRAPRHKTATIYMKPDDDAQYVETHEIDLSKVQSFITKYPRPDDVVPVVDCEGTELDGCFIGACTTTEADLILAALVLEEGLKGGMRPSVKGKRKVVPGSMAILYRLRQLGLIEVYQEAGFDIGIPGCSHCVGMSADQAAPGEVWLSSQNWNFENRMGKGRSDTLEYMEPSESSSPCCEIQSKGRIIRSMLVYATTTLLREFLIDMKTHEAAGEYCLQCTHPEFRVHVKGGFNIVVAGKAFGCGSSREQAVMALLGCGVKCVIAKSFAFIFQRNMPNLGLLGITMPEKSFHAAVEDGAEGKRLGVTPDRGITEFVDLHPELQW